MKKLLALFLCISLPAAAQDAPTINTESVKVVDVKRAALFDVDGHSLDVTGGCWLSTQTCIDAAREKVACADSKQKLEQAVITPPPQTVAVIVGLIAGAAAIGFGAGLAVAHFSGK